MFETVQFRTFRLLLFYIKMQRLNYTKLWFCMLVKSGILYYRKSTDWWCNRTRRWGEYLVLKRAEVTGDWRKLLNESHCNLYSPSSIISEMKSRTVRWAKRQARMSGMKSQWLHRFGWKAWRKQNARWPGRRWYDNIKINHKDLAWFIWLRTGIVS
jgi:hypothetical protein